MKVHGDPYEFRNNCARAAFFLRGICLPAAHLFSKAIKN
jgi:hypothetical protein